MTERPSRHELMRQVFEQALECAPEDRATYLAKAGADDPALLREVQQLLAAHAAAGSFLSTPATGVRASDAPSLGPGARLGAYEILALIGAGGMGEVYKARDTKLGRVVALKVLPAAVVQDRDRVARFGREARTLAALNHPNIAVLYGVEQAGDRQCLVMELVEGETLADRLKQGPLPVEDALRISRQMAEALDAAHEAGIIHRDLKPANVKVTPDERVKVLDFGLAKAVDSPVPGVSGDVTNSPTMTSPAMATGIGVLLGTAAYMAPEQAKGRAADKRSDLWAFGCVFYEMLTGKRAFDGEDISDALAAVLRGEPDWRAVPRGVPPSVQTILRRSLVKDRQARLADMSVVKFLLEEDATGAVPQVRRAHPSRGRLISIVVGSAVVGGIFVGVPLGFVGALRPPSSQQVTRLSITTPYPTLLQSNQVAIAISPDGTKMAYRAGASTSDLTNATGQLWLRDLGSFRSVQLQGTRDPQSPFFSPDGQWIAFFSSGKLKKVPVSGGAVVEICDIAGAYEGGAWGRDDTIVFSSMSGLMRVPAAGGQPELIAAPDLKRERTYKWPSLLPGGKAVLFAILPPASLWDEAEIAVRSLDTGEQHVVFHGGTRPRYVSEGLIVVERAGALLAVPFDRSRLRATGPPVTVVEGVTSFNTSGVAQYDVSDTGALVYFPGTRLEERGLTWVNRQGITQETGLKRSITDVSLSPDERLAAVVMVGEASRVPDIWIYEFDRGTVTRFTSSDGTTSNPRWTPDGRRIAYSVDRGRIEVFWKAVDGLGSEELLVKAEVRGQFPRSWSWDGRWLLFQRGTSAGANDLWVMPLAGGGKARPFVATVANETQAQFAPDGRWVAYQSSESGNENIFLQPFPDPGPRWQISTDGGQRPVWRGDGRELFYRSGERVMAVDVNLGQPVRIGTPHVLFQGQYSVAFDATRDGQRFLMIKDPEQRLPTQINVVLNWQEELKRLVPTR